MSKDIGKGLEYKKYLLDHWTESTEALEEHLKWYSKHGKDKIFKKVCWNRLYLPVKKAGEIVLK